MRALTINEELVGKFSAMGTMVEVYKNPKSVARMGSDNRAITNYNGDFYIASDEDGGSAEMVATHSDIYTWLQNRGEDIKIRWSEFDHMYVDGIAWQRYKDTKKFYIAESYLENEESAKEYIKAFIDEQGLFNPMGVKFVVELIDNAPTIEDKNFKRSDIDQYHHDTRGEYF
jgi:hypothetical protein